MGFSPVAGGAAGVNHCDTFAASGTWTCPTGVTYAIVHLKGGGGGGGAVGAAPVAATAGGDSTGLGFTAKGGVPGTAQATLGTLGNTNAGASAGVNSGRGGAGATCLYNSSPYNTYAGQAGGDGAELWAGVAVVPGTGYPIVVGTAGAAGTGSGANGGAGGTGWVEVWYQK